MPYEMKALCATMRAGVNSIVLRWIERVKADPFLHADDKLTHTQIVDHVPQMLDELCEVLEIGGEPDFNQIRAASHHGYIRSLEGYTLTELLRELEILRDCVFAFVADTEPAHRMTRAETILLLRTINEYFGEDIIFVVEHYLKKHI